MKQGDSSWTEFNTASVENESNAIQNVELTTLAHNGNFGFETKAQENSMVMVNEEKGVRLTQGNHYHSKRLQAVTKNPYAKINRIRKLNFNVLERSNSNHSPEPHIERNSNFSRVIRYGIGNSKIAIQRSVPYTGRVPIVEKRSEFTCNSPRNNYKEQIRRNVGHQFSNEQQQVSLSIEKNHKYASSNPYLRRTALSSINVTQNIPSFDLRSSKECETCASTIIGRQTVTAANTSSSLYDNKTDIHSSNGSIGSTRKIDPNYEHNVLSKDWMLQSSEFDIDNSHIVFFKDKFGYNQTTNNCTKIKVDCRKNPDCLSRLPFTSATIVTVAELWERFGSCQDTIETENRRLHSCIRRHNNDYSADHEQLSSFRITGVLLYRKEYTDGSVSLLVGDAFHWEEVTRTCTCDQLEQCKEQKQQPREQTIQNRDSFKQHHDQQLFLLKAKSRRNITTVFSKKPLLSSTSMFLKKNSSATTVGKVRYSNSSSLYQQHEFDNRQTTNKNGSNALTPPFSARSEATVRLDHIRDTTNDDCCVITKTLLNNNKMLVSTCGDQQNKRNEYRRCVWIIIPPTSHNNTTFNNYSCCQVNDVITLFGEVKSFKCCCCQNNSIANNVTDNSPILPLNHCCDAVQYVQEQIRNEIVRGASSTTRCSQPKQLGIGNDCSTSCSNEQRYFYIVARIVTNANGTNLNQYIQTFQARRQVLPKSFDQPNDVDPKQLT